MRSTRKRKLRKHRKTRGGQDPSKGSSKWWQRDWIFKRNVVSTARNQPACRKNAMNWLPSQYDTTKSQKNDGYTQQIISLHGDDKKKRDDQLADLACGTTGDAEMVWSNKGFWYDDQDKKKRVQQHAITKSFRNLIAGLEDEENPERYALDRQ